MAARDMGVSTFRSASPCKPFASFRVASGPRGGGLFGNSSLDQHERDEQAPDAPVAADERVDGLGELSLCRADDVLGAVPAVEPERDNVIAGDIRILGERRYQNPNRQ